MNDDLALLPEPLAGLVRDHERAEAVVAEARAAVDRAANRPESAARFADMLQELRVLEAFLASELKVHIAKEERALFPALRDLAREANPVIDDMLVQHDQIRERQALIQQTLAAVNAHQDTIGPAGATFAAVLHAASASAPADALTLLHESVTRLDWILQGHFGDEEQHLFLPARTLLTPEALMEMADQMAALEA